jgi:hypothetical protein
MNHQLIMEDEPEWGFYVDLDNMPNNIQEPNHAADSRYYNLSYIPVVCLLLYCLIT